MLKMANRATADRRKAWVAEAQKICGEWRSKYKSALESDAVPIRPERLCHELTQHVPDDAIVVVDTGHAGMWMGGMFDLKSPRQSYMRSAGHLGWAFPAGLGAKCACPDRPVVTFTGDAGFWYHIAEVETAARWNINAVTVVNNNGGGNQIASAASTASMAASRPTEARELGPSANQLRPPRRGHGRARHPRRAGFGIPRGAGAGARRRAARGDRRRHRHRGAGADGSCVEQIAVKSKHNHSSRESREGIKFLPQVSVNLLRYTEGAQYGVPPCSKVRSEGPSTLPQKSFTLEPLAVIRAAQYYMAGSSGEFLIEDDRGRIVADELEIRLRCKVTPIP